jgi:hypothetical protein
LVIRKKYFCACKNNYQNFVSYPVIGKKKVMKNKILKKIALFSAFFVFVKKSGQNSDEDVFGSSHL